MLVLLTTVALAAPTLTITGDCPGEVHLDVVGLAYGSTAVFLAGPDFGADALAGGRCERTVTGLDGPTLITTARDTDDDGRLLLRPVITNPAICERVVQVVDGADCSLSEPIRLGEPPGGVFAGYATWSQDVDLQSDAAQDAAMRDACADAYPGSVAATVGQISSGEIEGLPPTNDSGFWLVGACPDCAGSPTPSAVDGHCRYCVDPDVAFPIELPPTDGWHENCCTNTRSTLCLL
ncbi:MAG: hypothetical protein ACI8PZ_005080 [Myxococcota bacterium]|jgi:hypothetical protein